MKRIKYGKYPQKTIYITKEDENIWKEIANYAFEINEGIGTILMKLWKNRNLKSPGE